MSRLTLRRDWPLHQPTETGREALQKCVFWLGKGRGNTQGQTLRMAHQIIIHTHLVNLRAAVYVCVLEHVCVRQQACQQCFICKG